MIERIIICVCFILCAIPFWIIAVYNKDSITPITFWSGGEDKLKKEVKNIKEYNKEMALLYKKCAAVFMFTAVASCIHPILGMILFGLACTIGVYLVYREYKKILRKYS